MKPNSASQPTDLISKKGVEPSGFHYFKCSDGSSEPILRFIHLLSLLLSATLSTQNMIEGQNVTQLQVWWDNNILLVIPQVADLDFFLFVLKVCGEIARGLQNIF